MTRIVLLSMNTVSYDDVSFEDIEKLGIVSYANPKTRDETVEACKDVEIVLLNKTVMDEYVISRLPKLKFIGLFATGYNNIDLDACKKYGVICSNVPGYSTTAVAQHTMALLLSFTGSLPHYIQSVKDGYWVKSGQFSYYTSPMEELKGKTLGIYGMGNIGKRVAALASAFEMNVIFCNRSKVENTPFRQVSPEELFSTSDFISLHCPLSEETKELINEKTLSLMKPTTVLINTARGGLINEAALADALKNGRLKGACLDVVAKEPMPEDNPLYKLPNCYITPHVAWLPLETRINLEKLVAENVKAYLNGYPINVVSK